MKISVEPIGTFSSGASYKYEVPRQGVFFGGHPGKIELFPHKGFEEALRDLQGFERIWVIFLFHQNSGWRPTTRPPIPPADRERVGTFASRSPYRPNPIGLSCVKLLSIEKLTLQIDEADLLNGTPILDIKPYVPKADAFPNALAGWVDSQAEDSWQLIADEEFSEQNEWLLKTCGYDLKAFAECQLSNNPLDSSRKRVSMESDGKTGILAFRTFRILFSMDETSRKIRLSKIQTGYSPKELSESEDRYGDKALHCEFTQLFEPSGRQNLQT